MRVFRNGRLKCRYSCVADSRVVYPCALYFAQGNPDAPHLRNSTLAAKSTPVPSDKGQCDAASKLDEFLAAEAGRQLGLCSQRSMGATVRGSYARTWVRSVLTMGCREAWRYTGPFTRFNRFKTALPGLGTATVAFAIYCAAEWAFFAPEKHHEDGHGHGEH